MKSDVFARIEDGGGTSALTRDAQTILDTLVGFLESLRKHAS